MYRSEHALIIKDSLIKPVSVCEVNNNSSTMNSDIQDELFPNQLLKEIDWTRRKAKFNPEISVGDLGPGLVVRPLALSDYEKGFIQLLGELTDVGHVTSKDYSSRFRSMQRCQNTYFVTVVEDLNTGMIVGSATLVVEQKFIHDAGCRGRIEDVVVSSRCRGRQLGKFIVQLLTLLAEHVGCYKISLECKDHLIPFYGALGYTKDQNFLVQRFENFRRGSLSML